MIALFGISGCAMTAEAIDPIITEENTVDVLSQFESVQRDYIEAFCKSDGPLVYAVPFNEDALDPDFPKVSSFLCVPHEGSHAINIRCLDDDCSVGASKVTIQEFESHVREVGKQATDEPDYIESI